MGVFPSWNYQDQTIDLHAGDRLLLFTDGITEAADANDREFEESGLAEFAKQNAALPAKELNKQLMNRVTSFCNAQFHDDATLLVIASL